MPVPLTLRNAEERSIMRARTFAEIGTAAQAIWGHPVGSVERDRLCNRVVIRTARLWGRRAAAEIIRRRGV